MEEEEEEGLKGTERARKERQAYLSPFSCEGKRGGRRRKGGSVFCTLAVL